MLCAGLQQGLLSSVSDGVPHARGCRCFSINCLEKLLQAQLIRFPFLSFCFHQLPMDRSTFLVLKITGWRLHHSIWSHSPVLNKQKTGHRKLDRKYEATVRGH